LTALCADNCELTRVTVGQHARNRDLPGIFVTRSRRS
jgi:hypothetical protein